MIEPSLEEFMNVLRKSYLGDAFDSDPRVAAAWWGWRAARGELNKQGKEDESNKRTT